MPDFLTWMLYLHLSTQGLVETMAVEAGVDPRVAACVCKAENGFDAFAVGDSGRAVGLWQWHLSSWRYMRAQMGKNSAVDLRADPIASTEAALWAMTHGYGDWWSVWEQCGGVTQ